jgi:hypothetical protein
MNPSPMQCRLVHCNARILCRNVCLFTATRLYFAATSTYSLQSDLVSPQVAEALPQLNLVHRNVGLFTATRACSPQLKGALPQRRPVHRNVRTFYRNVGLLTAT